MPTGRLEAFSDGVIAIAITLLALELPRPEGPHLGEALRHAWPSYLAYFVSFAVIGIMWLNHHALLEVVRRTDRVLLLLNLWLLAFIALVPWTTAIVADNLRGPDANIAVAIYSATFIGTAIGFNAMWFWITRGPDLLSEEHDYRVLQKSRLRFGAGLAVYGVTLVVALVAPLASMALHALIAVYYLADKLSARTGQPRASRRRGSERRPA